MEDSFLILHFDNTGPMGWGMINSRNHFLTLPNNATEIPEANIQILRNVMVTLYIGSSSSRLSSFNPFRTPQNVTKIEHEGKCSVPVSSTPCQVAKAIKPRGLSSKQIRGKKFL